MCLGMGVGEEQCGRPHAHELLAEGAVGTGGQDGFSLHSFASSHLLL